MAKVAPMTKETESKLTHLLMEVVDSGSEPVSALTKIAQQASLTPGQVRLLGRAYNTGITLGQFREGESIREKGAAVTLVDPEAVIKNLYPDKIDTPAEKACKTAVSADYGYAPTDRRRRRLHNTTVMQKAAEEEKLLADTKPAVDLHGSFWLNKHAAEQSIKRTLDEARQVVYVNIYKAASAFDKLRDYFEHPGSLPVEYVQKNASAVYGRVVDGIFEHICKGLNRTKQAATSRPPTVWTKAPYSYIKDAAEAIKKHNAFNEKLAIIDSITESNKQAAKAAGNGPIYGSVLDHMSKSAAGASMLGGAAGGAGYGISAGVMEKLSPPPESEQVRGMIRKLDSGGHSADLQRIRMQSLLTELMLDDPVVSEFEPNAVFEAFNNLNEVAPRSIQHPLIAKSLIRRYLSQDRNLDAFDSEQLARIEKALSSQSASSADPEFALIDKTPTKRKSPDEG